MLLARRATCSVADGRGQRALPPRGCIAQKYADAHAYLLSLVGHGLVPGSGLHPCTRRGTVEPV